MAQNNVTDTIAQIKFLTGQTNLSNADAVRLINYASDKYTYLAISADGKAQVDDSGNDDDINRATTTLSSGTYKVRLGGDFLTWQYVEIEDSNGTRHRLKPYDQRFQEEVTPSSANTGRPKRYDYYGGVFYFDTYADQDYTIRAHYSRAFNHVSTDDLTATIGIPSHHAEYPALHASSRLTLANNDPSHSRLRDEVTLMERDITDFYRTRDEDMPQVLQAKMDVRR
jgi:hypothetical protein